MYIMNKSLLDRYAEKPINPDLYGPIRVDKLDSTFWFVYIVECSDGTLYTGISTDVSKRISTHNLGKGAKYTKTRLPVVLKWLKPCNNRSEASKEEHRIKKLTRKQKLALING
jgi:putative endonuclease